MAFHDPIDAVSPLESLQHWLHAIARSALEACMLDLRLCPAHPWAMAVQAAQVQG